MQQLRKTTDILCIQEHWLFNWIGSAKFYLPNTQMPWQSCRWQWPCVSCRPSKGLRRSGNILQKRLESEGPWTSWRRKQSQYDRDLCYKPFTDHQYLPSRKYVRRDSSTGDPSVWIYSSPAEWDNSYIWILTWHNSLRRHEFFSPEAARKGSRPNAVV